MKFWNSPRNILIILAHPDDPEFFCGATIAKWVQEGHNVNYCLFTKGEKGINDNYQVTNNIIAIREEEQKLAADILGVNRIQYLNYVDGMLAPNLTARKNIVRVIRGQKPKIVVTCDPTNYYINDNYLNHPDHRAAGRIVVDAVFPASQNKLFFPELLDEELEPHYVEEVWLSLPKKSNITIDVTESWPKKMQALEQHTSQIGDVNKFRVHMASKAAFKDKNNNPHYVEEFHRIIFSKN
jgi:LmbE family N-acetylglucosaminyl deacetylase